MNNNKNILENRGNNIWLPPQNVTYFIKPTELIMAQRKMEGLLKLAEIKAWGLRNPTKFMERFIGVELLDVQNYVIMNSWNKMYALWLATRNMGKSTLLALYYMVRGMLLNSCRCYICAGTSDQSIETFEKIVSIAKNEIESFTGLTDVFRNEVIVNQANSDGFIRNPAGFTYRLYDGSFVKCLNSNVNAKRGKRAEAVCFDECGWLGEEVFQIIEPYTAQDKDFKMGGGIDVTTLPKELPNQLLYTSSASSVSSYFYKKYKDYSKLMFAGSKDHFVADINCDMMIHATQRGKIYPTSLLSQKKVDTAMAENKEKALREYYNRFTTEATINAIIKRAVITRNSEVRPPELYNKDGNKKYILGYDPARSADNSVVLIGEIYLDNDKYKMRIVNLVNFVDLNKKNKTPLRTPEQVECLKQLILDYNGKNQEDYINIETLIIDAGTGGSGINIGDYLMEDWYEKGYIGNSKYLHRGLIDKEFSQDYVKKFPNADNKIKLVQPTTYKSEMYEALIQMMEQDLISFTETYDNKSYLTMLDVDQKRFDAAKDEIVQRLKLKKLSPEQFEESLEEELSLIIGAKTKTYNLSPEEEIALTQIDLLKEELVQMTRKKRESGKDLFELTSDKQNKMHDDRAYCIAMCAWVLQQKNRQHIINKKKPKQDIAQMFRISKQPKKWGHF